MAVQGSEEAVSPQAAFKAIASSKTESQDLGTSCQLNRKNVSLIFKINSVYRVCGMVREKGRKWLKGQRKKNGKEIDFFLKFCSYQSGLTSLSFSRGLVIL